MLHEPKQLVIIPANALAFDIRFRRGEKRGISTLAMIALKNPMAAALAGSAPRLRHSSRHDCAIKASSEISHGSVRYLLRAGKTLDDDGR